MSHHKHLKCQQGTSQAQEEKHFGKEMESCRYLKLWSHASRSIQSCCPPWNASLSLWAPHRRATFGCHFAPENLTESARLAPPWSNPQQHGQSTKCLLQERQIMFRVAWVTDKGNFYLSSQPFCLKSRSFCRGTTLGRQIKLHKEIVLCRWGQG